MLKFIISFTLWCLMHSFAWSTDNSLPSITKSNIGKYKLESVLASQNFLTIGEATFSILFWDLYKSQLRTTSGRYPITKDRDQLIFQIHYLADISNDDLIMRTIEQWQHQDIPKPIYQKYISKLATMWPNIKKGDRLAMLMQKDKSIFYFNNQNIGAIDDDIFGQLFIDIWLDKSTSEPSLRAQLLGENIDE